MNAMLFATLDWTATLILGVVVARIIYRFDPADAILRPFDWSLSAVCVRYLVNYYSRTGKE
jgi:hypothetical protein